MEIKVKITVRELTKGYVDNQDGGFGMVILTFVAHQREFIW